MKPITVKIDRFEDMHDLDDGSYYVYLSFKDGITFDFGFSKSIGELLGISFHKSAMNYGAYYRRTGDEYFFENKTHARAFKRYLDSIVEQIYSNNDKFLKMKLRFEKMVLLDAEKSKEQGFLSDYTHGIKNLKYYNSLINE